MADKNRNGIPDDRENLFRPGQKAGGLRSGYDGRAGVNPYFDSLESGNVNPGLAKPGERTPIQALLGLAVNPLRQGMNAVSDLFDPVSSQGDRVGNGWGDRSFGVQRGYYDNVNKTARRPAKQARTFQRSGEEEGPQGTSPMSFADALAQALSMVGGTGGGDIPMMNFDPERNAARSTAAEADARYEAMYRQLRGSIDADAPKIQAAYTQAIDNTNAGAERAQGNAQAAVDASQARNQSVLGNLGIQDANAQIIGEGRDANTQAAAAIGDMAQAQQAATTNLTANQASSVQQNQSIGNAAGLEGNLQRAQNQAKLQSLLAQIDMEEQGQNSQIAQQNASRQQSGMGNALSLASQLYGYNREDIASENNLQMEAMKMNQPSDFLQMMQNFEMLTQDRGGDLGPVVDSSTLTPEQLASILKAIR